MSNESGGIISRFGLTNFQLKIIALTTMVIDHAGIIFGGFNGMDLSWMRVIGRISFPVFAFLISEGCRHTRDMTKYMFRLLMFGLIANIPVIFKGMLIDDFAVSESLLNGLPNYNIFFTLLAGVVSVYFHDKIMKGAKSSLMRFAAYLPFITLMLLAEIMGSDYGAIGVFMIFTAYVAKTKILRIACILLSIIVMYYEYISADYLQQFFSGESLMLLAPFFAALSLVFISFYNGKKGKGYKWFFYLAYPGHFIILIAIYSLFSLN